MAGLSSTPEVPAPDPQVPAPDVVVLGCAGVDTNVFLPGRGVDWSVEANFTENLIGSGALDALTRASALGPEVG